MEFDHLPFPSSQPLGNLCRLVNRDLIHHHVHRPLARCIRDILQELAERPSRRRAFVNLVIDQPFRADCGQHVQPEPLACELRCGCLSPLAPRRADVVIGTHARLVGEHDQRVELLRAGNELRIVAFLPVLDRFGILLVATDLGALAAETEALEGPPYGRVADGNAELIQDELTDDSKGPEDEAELHLDGILLPDGIGDPLRLLSGELAGATGARLVLQGIQTTEGVASGPSDDGTEIDVKSGGKGLGCFTLLVLKHDEGADGDLLVRRE